MSNLPDSAGPGFAASYFDGRSAKRHDVIVARTREGLRITGATIGEIVWLHSEFRRDYRMAVDEPVRLERGGDTPEVLVVNDHRFLPAPVDADGNELDPRAELKRRRRVAWLIAPAVAVIAFLVAMYGFAVPRMAERVAPRIPLQFEESLGRPLVEAFTTAMPTCGNPEGLAALNKMVGALTADGRGGRYSYNVTVIDDSLVNAMAAPGGFIVLFTGLLQQAETQEELAGVLAHEIQHVVKQHGVKGVLRSVPAQLMASALLGREGFGASAGQMAVTLSNLSYGRKDELEADAEGMNTLAAAHVAPNGMLRFFETLSQKEGEASGPEMFKYLSTHPNSAERLQALQGMASQLTYEPQPILTDAEWSAVRSVCSRK